MVKVNRLLSNEPPGGFTTRGPTLPFPYEIMEMIITHLIHDLRTLKACSLASRSWYIVAVPHLHHTLTLKKDAPDHTGGKKKPRSTRDRLRPLPKLRNLGLMSFVEELRVDDGFNANSWFVPEKISRRDLRYFSGFTNVHTLKLQNFEIYRFIPRIKRHFGHFSQTLRSLTLYRSHCTPQQLSHFLSLFSNLDNVELQYTYISRPWTTDPAPFSVPAPKLRGRLTLYGSHKAEAWSCLISSRGGLRFCHIDLRKDAGCEPVLLKACARTLETLRFNAEAALDSK